jgi:hypothetical protein
MDPLTLLAISLLAMTILALILLVIHIRTWHGMMLLEQTI